MHHITINSERLEAAHIKLPFAVITVYLFPLLEAFFDSKIYIVIVLGGEDLLLSKLESALCEINILSWIKL